MNIISVIKITKILICDDLSSAWIEANHQESTKPVEGSAQRGAEVLMKKMVKILIS